MKRNVPHWRFWLIVLAVIIGLACLLRSMLAPFLAGLMIAYFLDPLVEKLVKKKIPLTKKKWPRWFCALIVLGGFLLLLVMLALLLLPMLQAQIAALMEATPAYIEKFRNTYLPSIQNWASQWGVDDMQKINEAAANSASSVAVWLATFTGNIVSTSFALLDIIALIILTPVVAFYMLHDWQKITATLDSLIPQHYYDVIYAQLKEIDDTLSGFIRGQAVVCAILGVYYGLGLTLAHLQYGAAVGVLAGVLTFIPYVGSTFGWVTSLFLAMTQFDGDWSRIAPVLGIFIVGQILETYFLTPHFVGNRVKLHPVWVIFALLAGAHLFGFTGVLLAVPVAAVCGVLIRFSARQYRASSIYKETL